MKAVRLASHAFVLLVIGSVIASCAPMPPAVAISQMRGVPPVAASVAAAPADQANVAPAPAVQPAVIGPAAVPSAQPAPSPAASPAASPVASPSPASAIAPKVGEPVLEEGSIILPSVIPTDRPLQVLIAFHGAGGSGPRLAERLADCSAHNSMVIVAPSMVYRDYMDPEQVRLDDQQNLPKVLAMLNTLQARLNVPIDTSKVSVYGFSRGGQMAHRFALFYPERVAGVAALSSGNYTIPKRETQVSGQAKPLAFPYGVSDLQKYTGTAFNAAAFTKIPFWIGIGGADSSPDQVPHAWDAYIGANRLERARRFTDYLTGMGVKASLEVFNGTGHEETANMRTSACDFLSGQTRLAA